MQKYRLASKVPNQTPTPSTNTTTRHRKTHNHNNVDMTVVTISQATKLMHHWSISATAIFTKAANAQCHDHLRSAQPLLRWSTTTTSNKFKQFFTNCQQHLDFCRSLKLLSHTSDRTRTSSKHLLARTRAIFHSLVTKNELPSHLFAQTVVIIPSPATSGVNSVHLPFTSNEYRQAPWQLEWKTSIFFAPGMETSSFIISENLQPPFFIRL